MASAHDADIYKEGAGITANEFLLCLQEAEDGSKGTAIRWLVVLNDCEQLALQLQGHSASANMMNGTLSRGKHTVSYRAFCGVSFKIQLVPADGLCV
jgi:hypothetical protein